MADSAAAQEHIDQAVACMQEGRYEDALRHTAEAVTADPTSAHAWYVMGCAHTELGDDPSAPRLILTEPGIGYRWIGQEPG